MLVLDRQCRDIVSPLIRVNDLRKHGVTLHLLLESERRGLTHFFNNAHLVALNVLFRMHRILQNWPALTLHCTLDKTYATKYFRCFTCASFVRSRSLGTEVPVFGRKHRFSSGNELVAARAVTYRAYFTPFAFSSIEFCACHAPVCTVHNALQLRRAPPGAVGRARRPILRALSAVPAVFRSTGSPSRTRRRCISSVQPRQT